MSRTRNSASSVTRICAIRFLYVFCFLASSITASADELDSLRSQTAIATSYNFKTLPASAGKGISIAIISTGVDPKLKAALGSRIQAESISADEATPDDGNNVGTQLISIVAALAPGAHIISIKALDKDGHGTFDVMGKAVDRASSIGANIIVLPVGTARSSNSPNLTSAITAALKNRILVVASAGNTGSSDIAYPANISGVVAVGATDGKDNVAAFSNRGGKIILHQELT